MNEILYNHDIITVYSDYSAILGSNIAGLAGCFIGNGNSSVKARTYYFDNKNKNESIYGEMLAVTFCLKNLPDILNEYQRFLKHPNKVILYSDIAVISKVQENSITFRKQHYVDAAKEIRQLLTELQSAYPLMSIHVEFLGKERKQGNSYYKSAHKAARKVIGK
jgi:hypothetical protein